MQTASTSIIVGSHVWVEDSEEAWKDGEVVEVHGEEITIKCTSGEKVGAFYGQKKYVFFYCLRSSDEQYLSFAYGILTLSTFIR